VPGGYQMTKSSDKPILFYDGHCSLCSGFVQFVMARDRASRVSYAPLQSPEVGRFLLRHNVDAARLDTMVCAIGDRVYTKSTAVIKILQYLPEGWWAVRLLLAIPASIRDWAYDVVGTRRLQWFGRRDVCFLPSPEMSASVEAHDQSQKSEAGELPQAAKAR
jgi:predicted DCC family thiol-disulfide oxidoreductase YuxK